MMRHHLVAFALSVAIVGAACTTEESSTPGPTLTSTTSTAPTTTSTTMPTTTTTVETTTTAETATTSPTTTEPPVPIDALVPLLIGGENGGWLYLGSWQFDRWTQAVDSQR